MVAEKEVESQKPRQDRKKEDGLMKKENARKAQRKKKREEEKPKENQQEDEEPDQDDQEKDAPSADDEAVGDASTSSSGSSYASPLESINSDTDPQGLSRGRTTRKQTAPKRITDDAVNKPKYEPQILHVEAGCTTLHIARRISHSRRETLALL